MNPSDASSINSTQLKANQLPIAELASRYKQLRTVNKQLNEKLVQQLNRTDLDVAGHKLGFMKRGSLFFDAEDDMALLMDYAIYNVFRDGLNAIRRMLRDSQPEENSVEMLVLQAALNSTYSVIIVDSVVPGLGFCYRDVFTNEVGLLADLSLAASAGPGAVMATRLIRFPEFAITGGAGMPAGMFPPTPEGIDEVRKFLSQCFPGIKAGFDPAPLIKEFYKAGSMEGMHFQNHEQTISLQTSPSRSAITERSAKAGRNDPCPCGSGRKFKNCCLKD